MNTTIIGGGLAGLTAAAVLARAGRQVTLYEKSQLGGRARTTATHGALFNEGPHALYRAGRAMKVLRGLGIEPEGGVPALSGNLAWHRGQLHALPVGVVSLLSTSLLSAADKLAVAPLLARLDAPEGTLEEWLCRSVRGETARDFLRATFRVATYANDPSLSARAAVRQLQLGLKANVLYLHGGWQTLVDALREKAVAAGVRIVEHQRIDALPEGDVILAVSPKAVTELTGATLDVTPVRAACLDLALDTLPQPRRTFALGIDRPLYFSVHTRSARVAERDGLHVIHLAKYLGPQDAGADALPELEALCDAMQPGWRGHVVAKRFLPEMVVSNAVVTPNGRPAVDAVPGVLLAGDWVGPEGMLADAALASAQAAAERVLARSMKAVA
jgi:glycine/D-amino acid oxidase-like deaminating enzyme